jgi:dihydroceramide fatty acyl 2-hydroxylase
MRNLTLGLVPLGFPQSLLIPSGAASVMIWLWMRTPAALGMSGESSWTSGLMLLAAGLTVWTLLEYLLHRFMLHGVEPFRRWHLQHHLHPDVPMRTPILFSLTLVLALAILPALLSADMGFAAPFSCGLILGHLLQEVVHHRLHKSLLPSGNWIKARWRHHDFHHHHDEHSNYGTLTGFWDGIFITHG